MNKVTPRSLLLAVTMMTLYPSCIKPPKNQANAYDLISTDSYIETDQNLLKTADSAVWYINHQGDRYNLYRVKAPDCKLVQRFDHPVFYPFQFHDTIGVLIDSCGNEKYTSNLPAFNQVIKQQIKRIYTSSTGKYLLYEKKDGNTYLYHQQTNTERQLADISPSFSQPNFSADDSLMTYKDGTGIYLLTLSSGRVKELATSIKTEKYNPYLDGKQVYFATRGKADFTAIHKTAVNDPANRATLVLSSNHDLRMPSVYDGNLYYIEINQSRYLFKKTNLKTGETTDMYVPAVMYTYLHNQNTVYYTSSNSYTPKLLYIGEPNGQVSKIIDHISTEEDMTIQIYPDQNGDSLHYLIKSRTDTTRKGIVLYLHPGLHSDYSPRFEPMLANLARNSYPVVAANYPGSKGYGYTYESQSIDEAAAAVKSLIKQLHAQYQVPVYLLTSSSGNLLAEMILREENNGIAAAASLFGLSEKSTKPIKTPTLYLLGENDPQIDYSRRSKQLSTLKANNRNIYTQSYPCEGHWFRSANNQKDAAARIIRFFLNH